MDGVDNLNKWYVENLDENVDEDYICIYKYGIVVVERRGIVLCEII